MRFVNDIVLLAIVAAAAWWLSGHDSRVTHENIAKDRIRRLIRCALTLVLFIGLLMVPVMRIALVFVYAISIGLAALWIGPVTEFSSHAFQKMIGGGSSSHKLDPKESLRNVDTIAAHIREGRRDEAVKMYETLKASGDANRMVIETLLHRAGIPYQPAKKTQPLMDAHRLRVDGKPAEAETILKSLLVLDPANLDAAMMLMRLYVQDLRQPDKAAAVLQQLRQQPHISPGHLEFAERSLVERTRKEKSTDAMPQSVDELLKAGYLGTAIDILEQQASEQPGDFEAQLKLAEAYGLYSRDLPRASKIIAAMEVESAFTTEQIHAAQKKLEEWRAAKPRRN